jgi:acyl-CoA thioesterase-1
MPPAHRFAPPRRAPSRRALIVGAAALLAPRAAFAAGKERIVTVLGDSITAGYGLPASDALPAQLDRALARLAARARVRGAGVSGDTTADGLARVEFSVQVDTAVCLVALGGNDLLQGVDPRQVQANLAAIVRRLRARRIGVVLAGMQAPPRIGRAYASAFNAAFPAAARSGGAVLYPQLMAGVGRDPALLQSDAIHPNAAGVRIIAARLAPVLARALAARG